MPFPITTGLDDCPLVTEILSLLDPFWVFRPRLRGGGGGGGELGGGGGGEQTACDVTAASTILTEQIVSTTCGVTEQAWYLLNTLCPLRVVLLQQAR